MSPLFSIENHYFSIERKNIEENKFPTYLPTQNNQGRGTANKLFLRIAQKSKHGKLVKWAASWQNQRNGMCAQRRLRAAWASTQSDQSLRCPHEESWGPELPTERTAKTLIRLGGCPDWSESSVGPQSFCWFCHETAQIFSVLTSRRFQCRSKYSL